MNSKFFRALAARLPLLLIASLLGGVVTSVPARAVACAEGSAAQNNIAVSPSHGQVFYIDTGVSPIIDATYVGYRVTNTTGATLSNHWVSLSNFTGGVVSLARPILIFSLVDLELASMNQ